MFCVWIERGAGAALLKQRCANSHRDPYPTLNPRGALRDVSKGTARHFVLES
jgi:hypothetical protein